MNSKDHDRLSSTGPPIALGYATTNFSSQFPLLWSNPCHTEYFHLLLLLKGYYFQVLKSKRCLHNKVIYKIYNPKIKDERAINLNSDIYIYIYLHILQQLSAFNLFHLSIFKRGWLHQYNLYQYYFIKFNINYQ